MLDRLLSLIKEEKAERESSAKQFPEKQPSSGDSVAAGEGESGKSPRYFASFGKNIQSPPLSKGRWERWSERGLVEEDRRERGVRERKV